MPSKMSDLSNIPGTLSSIGDTPLESRMGTEVAESSIPEPATIPEAEVSPEESNVTASEEEAAKDALESYEKTPVQLWEEELTEIGVTRDQAMIILDNIMVNGLHKESYRIGKTRVTLRTRTTVDADRLMEILQDQQPETTGVYAHLVTRVNLAASIESYGATKFAHTTPTEDNRATLDYEWRERYKFCASLPAPAFYTLGQVLQKFDSRVGLACDARGVENF